jgi:hypothetical protein
MPSPTCAACPSCMRAAAWHRYGSTPLMWAAEYGATAAVASLMELRANLDAQSNVYG